MNKNESFAIFGLGRYGTAVAKELVANGVDVLAVDTDQKIVNDAAAFLPVCKCADITDPEVIDRLGIKNIDTVIVCMAGDLEASVMAITLCKEAGVKTVIAKCATDMHKKIFLRIGADHVVFPENDSGIRLAKNIVSSGFIDMISLSENVSLVEIEVKDEWVDKTLVELHLRRKYHFNIIAIREGESINATINPELPLKKSMTLIVLADPTKLSKLK